MSDVVHYGAETSYTDLKDKVAIITGAGAIGDGIGNGRAAAIQLARQGAHRTAEMIKAEGGSVIAARADVSLVGNVVLFLFSDASRFMTGQILVVDGGVSLTSAAR